MGLVIRMMLYFVFGAIAGQGVGVFDPASGTLTLQVDDLTPLLVGFVGYIVTFVAGRWAKVRGGLT